MGFNPLTAKVKLSRNSLSVLKKRALNYLRLGVSPDIAEPWALDL